MSINHSTGVCRMHNSYILRSHIVEACKNMEKFYNGLASYYKQNGLDIESNRGRRNILMSEPMEHFVAQELQKTNEAVFCRWTLWKS